MSSIVRCKKLFVAKFLLAILVLSPFSTSQADHLEAKMYVITDWTTQCTGNDLAYWDDMVDFWYNEMDNHGWYHRDGRVVDGSLDRDPFCDPDSGGANCRDHRNIEDADALMLGMHGGDFNNHWRGSLRLNGGSAVNDCRIDAAESSAGGEMMLGDVDTEFVHFSSCNSMDDDNITRAYHFFQDPNDSPSNGRRLHQANGFHGFMWIGGCCDDQYEDFASDAHDVSIKDAWMDNMFVTGINGSATQCPVAYAVGTSTSNCFDRIDNERYNNVFDDPSAINNYCYYYYEGCDPSGESAFVDPN